MKRKKKGEEQKKFGSIFCPKLGEEQKKRFSLKFGPIFCSKSGMDEGQGRKKYGSKLDATASTLLGPPGPGSGYDVPPEPPSRRPWFPFEIQFSAFLTVLLLVPRYFSQVEETVLPL